MKALRVLAFAAGLCALTIVSGEPTRAADYSGRVVTGELVAMSGSQFRIVGQPGSFSAPGVDLQALDGKTVEVEIGSGGKVAEIRPHPVPINPVTHGWSTVRGQLAVIDPLNGRFTFAGDDQAYIAPSSVNISSYAGRMVEAKIDENGKVTELQPIAGMPAQAGIVAPAAVGTCSYSGQIFSAGAAVCQSGTQFRCDGTHWQSLGLPCRAGAADAPLNSAVVSSRSCPVGDATVANGSSICRSGTTFRCDDGAWISLGTACQ